MDILKLYWSTSLQNGHRNFGDWLSPRLCEALSGMKVVHARPNRCDLMALGSILGKAKNHFWNRRIDIWGSGLIARCKPFKSPHRIHAVRGWHTARAISNQQIAVVGDPGLLCDILVPGNIAVRKDYSVGLIPHYVDRENTLIRSIVEQIPRARCIDIFSETLDFIRQVAACEYVLSSSMHGLITADALGVPNAWIRLSDKVWGEDFKFHDYFSVFGLENVQPFPLERYTSLRDIEQGLAGYGRPGLQDIKTRLYQAFPYKKSS
ncbi:MAG: polysaccharide pyruvyl transferase family protein [Syntrophotalea acetylenica]|nr:polysaccharide pyruvyl transferase family protein [Syntrophotalea acetylenica]